MSTQTKEETKNNYNIDKIKQNASTGMGIQTQGDLQRYGIDYSQAQRDEIAGIFQKSATDAYGAAQNQYANTMAQQQASLQDTIRRSQAQAVATGASRGMQAANELSNMLGLQEEAAKGATEMQGNYAQALANAQQQAMEIQNARAQTGAQIAAADIAGEAQKYSVGMDYQANDPYRVLTEIAALRASGDNAAADTLLTSWLASHGVSDKQIDVAKATTNPTSNTHEWVAAGNGASNLNFSRAYNHNLNPNFEAKIGGSTYKLELKGTTSSAGNVDPKITKAAIDQGVPNNVVFLYQGDSQLYIRSGNTIYKVGARTRTSKSQGQYNQAKTAAEKAGLIVK